MRNFVILRRTERQEQGYTIYGWEQFTAAVAWTKTRALAAVEEQAGPGVYRVVTARAWGKEYARA